MRNAGLYTTVALILLIQVHCQDDPVNTLIKLLDRIDDKPIVQHLQPQTGGPVHSLFQLFDRTEQKPMVVVMGKGKEPRSLDFVVDDGTGSDNSIREMFGFGSATNDEDTDDSLDEKVQKNVEALAQELLLESDRDQVEQQISMLRQDLISRCGKKVQCGKKTNQGYKTSNCQIKYNECSEESSEEECGKKTTKCPPKWFSTGRPSW